MDGRTAEVLGSLAGDQAERELAFLKLGVLLAFPAQTAPALRVTRAEMEALHEHYRIVISGEPDGTVVFVREARA